MLGRESGVGGVGGVVLLTGIFPDTYPPSFLPSLEPCHPYTPIHPYTHTIYTPHLHPQNINMYVVARFTFERTLAGDYVPSYTMTTLNLDNSPVNTANLGSTALEFILHLIILYLIYAQSLDMYVRRETY